MSSKYAKSQNQQSQTPEHGRSAGHGPYVISRRQFVKGATGTALALTWFGSFPGKLLGNLKPDTPTNDKSWWFVFGSDSHSNAGPDTDPMEVFLGDVRQAFPHTEFVIDTGDITEHGWEEELDRSRAAIETYDKPVYTVMGNHDSRWSRSGRYAYRNRFGDTHWVIERKNLAVILVDSSVLLEQYGHLDPSELAWLEAQLQKLEGKPALVGFHHPPCLPVQYLDSDRALFELLAAHNVPAIMAGHIHSRREYRVNDIQVITSGGVVSPKAVYCAWEITGENAILHERDPVKDELRQVLSLPLDQRKRGALTDRLDPLKTRRWFGKWHMKADQDLWQDGVELLLNGKLQEESTIVSRSAKRLKLELDSQPAGHYEIAAVTPAPDASAMQWRWGDIYQKPDDAVKLRWEINLPAGIQSRPAVFNDRVIVGTNDGTLHARSVSDGAPDWQYKSGPGAILSNPLIHQNRLYFGTIDERLICLDPATGREIWAKVVPGSVIASGRMAGEFLIVGTGKGIMLAIDPENGEIRWQYQTGNLIKATPAYDGSNLYFGAWDGKFYAINAAGGKEVWAKSMTIPHLSPATCNPGVLGDRVIVVTHDYATHCLDSATGEELWKFPKGYDEFDWQSPLVAKCKPSYSSPVFYEGIAYMTSITGHVVGMNVATGEQVLELDIWEEIFDSFPVLLGNQFYFGTLRGKFTAVNLDSGQISRSYSLGPGFIFSPPGVGSGVIALGNMNGRLACFGV